MNNYKDLQYSSAIKYTNKIYMLTFIKNNKIYKIITDTAINIKDFDEVDKAFKNVNMVYCIINDNTNVITYVSEFKTSLYMNTTISCGTFINSILKYNNISYNTEHINNLKLMMDHNYKELCFENNDTLTI
jgi:hypothetical protein